MPDPITTLELVGRSVQLASAAWTVGQALYTFAHDTKHINETVRDLSNEVKELGNACNLVEQQLKGLVPLYEEKKITESNVSAGEDGCLWTAMDSHLHECEESIARLDRAIAKVRTDRSNVVTQAWRQVRLNMNKADIAATKARIVSHKSALHTCLLSINIKVAHLAPQHATRSLKRKLSTLQTMMESLQDLVSERKAQNITATQPAVDGIEGLPGSCTDTIVHELPPSPLQLASDEAVLRGARQVLLEGNSLYEASIADGSVIDEDVHSAYDEGILSWISQVEALKIECKTAWHEEQQPGNCLRLKSMPIIDEIESEIGGVLLATADRETHDLPRKDDDQTNALIASTDPPEEVQITGPSSFDSDDDFECIIAKQAMRTGVKAFDCSDFVKADALLQETLQLVQELPQDRRDDYDPYKLQFMLAVCSFHLHSPSVAESALLRIIDPNNRSSHSQQALYICDAGHLLAQVYVYQGKLELASMTCKNVLVGKYRLFGLKHSSCFESLALMSRICHLHAKYSLATVYLDLIPPPHRLSHTEKFKDLIVRPMDPNASSHNGVAPDQGDFNLEISKLGAPDSVRKTGTFKDRSDSRRLQRVTSVDTLKQSRNTRGPGPPEKAAMQRIDEHAQLNPSHDLTHDTLRQNSLSISAEKAKLRKAKSHHHVKEWVRSQETTLDVAKDPPPTVMDKRKMLGMSYPGDTATQALSNRNDRPTELLSNDEQRSKTRITRKVLERLTKDDEAKPNEEQPAVPGRDRRNDSRSAVVPPTEVASRAPRNKGSPLADVTNITVSRTSTAKPGDRVKIRVNGKNILEKEISESRKKEPRTRQKVPLAASDEVEKTSKAKSAGFVASADQFKNPELLSLVEDAVKRVILPEIEAIKKDQRKQSKRMQEKIDSVR